MSHMVAVRLDERLLARVDAERKRRGMSRARAVQEALHCWLERGLLEEAIRQEHEAYARQPVRRSEFRPLIGAQALRRISRTLLSVA